MNLVVDNYPNSTGNSMGGLPNDVRTALMKGNSTEKQLLASWLLNKTVKEAPTHIT